MTSTRVVPSNDILGLEEFSTPPSTPGPITINRKQGDWKPHTELTNIDVPMLNHSISPPMPAEDTLVTFARSQQQPQLQKVTSPCFVHSHLDKGMMLADWLKNKHHSAEINDVGLAKSLQSTSYNDYTNSSLHPSAISDLDRGLCTDEDESGNNLTKRLAETAVTVREMSKQLGRARIRSNIQTVLVVTKARDNRLIKLTRQLALYLMLKCRPGSTRGLIVYVDSQLRHSKRFDAEGLKRDYPELFIPFPKRSSSTHSVSSLSSNSTHTEYNDEGQLRYWTSNMCRHSPHWFDFVVTLGGDGTVLFTSWLFQRIVPPVLSFSLGSLGFLTNFDFANHEADMASAIDDGIRVNLRMRFTCTVYRAVNQEDKQRKAVRKGDTGEIMMKNIEEGGWEALEGGWTVYGGCKKDKEIMCFTTRPVETFEVLNDLVVDRGPSPYVSLLELFGDEHHMTTVQADGLTIATPTGSTAYSLSAGGSLVHPEIPAILITPICPHTLSFRPMLLPDSLELRICVPYNSRSTAWASFDGRGRVELKQGDHIKVTASKYPFPTVCADKQSTDWFHAISRTLKWNERERQKSFVVVEEDAPPKPQRRSKPRLVDMHSSFDDEDEDEVTDHEEEKFDIDDSAPEADATTNGAKITAMDRAIGTEKTQGNLKLLQTKWRTKSRSRSRSRNRTSAPPRPLQSDGVVSPNRYATKPPHPSSVLSRHVGFDVPSPASSVSSLVSDAAHEGTRDDLRSPYFPSGNSRIPKDRDFDLPTSGQHDHRAFAVWGQDESDSATSDNDS